MPRLPNVDWTSRTGPRVFAYLRPSISGCEQLLTAMQQLDADVLCAVPGLPGDWIGRFDKLRFVTHPVDLAALLPRAELVISYGAGAIATALLAAVPVLLIPQVVEQYLAGLALERTGA